MPLMIGSQEVAAAYLGAQDASIYLGDTLVKGGGLQDIAPVTSWRVPVLAAYDSAGDAALVSAMIAAGSDKTRPSYTIASGVTRTFAWQLGTIDAPGAVLTFAIDGPTVTVTTAYSDNSTNGSDGTWTDLGFAPVSPTSFITDRRQPQLLPAHASGRWVRLVIQNSSGSSTYTVRPLVHQLQAEVIRNDAQLIMGASQMTRGAYSVEYENAIIAAYPDADPIVFNGAEAGETVAGVLANASAAIAAFEDICGRVDLDNLIGNNVTDQQPISNDDPATLTAMRDNVDAVIAAFDGWYIFITDITYRAYTGVTPTSPDDGSLPYNTAVMRPAIAAALPEAFDASLGVARMDLYSWGLYNRNWLDGVPPIVHYSDYTAYRAEMVRTMEYRTREGSWPDTFTLYIVKRLEAERLYHLKREAGYIVDSLPASATKTALQARVAAVTDLLPTRVKIDWSNSSSKATMGWNTTARLTVGVALTDMLTEDNWKSTYGWSVTSAANNTLASGGAQGVAPGFDFPDAIVLDLITDTADSMADKMTGCDAGEVYRLKFMGSRSGTGTRLQDFVIGAETQTINVLGNVSAVADFVGVAPTAGEISVTMNRGADNVTGIYKNGAIIEIEAA